MPRSSRERRIFRRRLGLRFWRVAMAWYGATMRFGEKGPPVRVVSSIDEIVAAIQGGELYRADKAVDKMSHPRKVEARLLGDKTIGDCEDHASWALAAMLKAGLVDIAYLVTVQFIDDRDEVNGHAVAAYELDGVLRWLDYGPPRPSRDWADMAHQIARGYRAEPIGVTWSRAELRDDDGLTLRRGGCRVFDVE